VKLIKFNDCGICACLSGKLETSLKNVILSRAIAFIVNGTADGMSTDFEGASDHDLGCLW
jgi:hypothetical protein